MTKKRKSLVEREADATKEQFAAHSHRTLPTPEETDRSVKRLLADHQEETRGPGRPKKEHNRERFTTIIEKDLRAKVKIIAAREDRQIHDCFNEAVAQYVAQYEAERGKIDL